MITRYFEIINLDSEVLIGYFEIINRYFKIMNGYFKMIIKSVYEEKRAVWNVF